MPRGRVPEWQLALSVGGKAGSTIYFGDLVDQGRARWTIAGFGEKGFQKWLAGRLEFDFGQCHGGQEGADGELSLDFKTTFFSLSGLAKFEFLNVGNNYDADRPFNPYFGLGGGIYLFNCKKSPAGSGVDGRETLLAKFGEDYPYADWQYSEGGLDFAPHVLGMVGVRYAYTPKLSFLFEIRGDLLFTDDFDAHQGWPNYRTGEWIDSDGKFDCLYTVAIGAQYTFHEFNKWTNTSGKYSRRQYSNPKRKFEERNAKRQRRR